MAEPPVRPILTLKRCADGLFIEPDDSDTPENQIIWAHNRERWSKKLFYADELGCGDGHTVDPLGRYNCGRCNQVDDASCLWVKIARVDRQAGSCKAWETIRASDGEMVLRRVTPEQAAYGVAVNGIGFGCKRCPFAKKAKHVDSEGRPLWCGEGGFHVTPNACCEVNGAPVKKAAKGTVRGELERAYDEYS